MRKILFLVVFEIALLIIPAIVNPSWYSDNWLFLTMVCAVLLVVAIIYPSTWLPDFFDSERVKFEGINDSATSFNDGIWDLWRKTKGSPFDSSIKQGLNTNEAQAHIVGEFFLEMFYAKEVKLFGRTHNSPAYEVINSDHYLPLSPDGVLKVEPETLDVFFWDTNFERDVPNFKNKSWANLAITKSDIKKAARAINNGRNFGYNRQNDPRIIHDRAIDTS